MTLPAAVALASALLCTYAGVLSLRLAQAPRWPDQRWFAIVAFTAAGFIACDIPNTVGAMGAWALWATTGVQFALACGNVAGWLVLSRQHLGLPARWPERAALVVLGLLGLGALVPGLIFRPELRAVEVAWLGVTYRLVPTTTLGDLAFGLDLALLTAVLIRYARAVPRLGGEAAWAVVGLAATVLAGLNDSLLVSGVWATPSLLDLGYLVPVGAMAMIQAGRVVRSAQDLDALSARLEREVEARSQALLEARQSLDRSERLAALGQLAAGVAHEVNNPAAALQANLTYLLRALQAGTLPRDAVESLEESLTSVGRIARIVRELRDSSRAAAGPVELEAVGLEPAVRSALATLKGPLAGAEVQVEVSPELWALGNEAYLVQVLTNLLSNAAQAARPGQPARIAVHAARAGERVQLEVVDQGVGIAPGAMKRLFEPFFTTKPVGQGQGLGLSVSLGLVRSMGGTLGAESAPGGGARFRIELPRASAPASRPALPEALAPARRRLLLVDDDPQVRHSLERLLRERYEVVVAEGVQDGLLKALEGRRPEVVLCDLMMADGGGRRLYELLNAAHPELAARVVFLTGGATAPEVEAFLLRQPQPHLLKPLDLEALGLLVERVAAPGHLLQEGR